MLYDTGPNGIWVFLLVTGLLGGVAAFVSGRAIADTWRPAWHAAAYMIPLGIAVRFVQFAVFGAPLLSVRSYLIDLLVLLAASVTGFQLMRRQQMALQYGWLGEADATPGDRS